MYLTNIKFYFRKNEIHGEVINSLDTCICLRIHQLTVPEAKEKKRRRKSQCLNIFYLNFFFCTLTL